MPECQVRIKKVGPSRYRARVDCCIDMLTGEHGDTLGATAEGGTPGEAIEDASAKLIALMRANPTLAAGLLPFAGPEITAILVAARYLDAPEIIHDVAAEAKALVKSTAKELKKAAKVAKKVGKGIAKVGSAAKSIAKKFKIW